MAHDHVHEKDTNYYLEQLCTIGISALLGGVAIMLYRNNVLRFMLAEKFHIWVLLGGIALLGIVVVRAVSLWLSVRPTESQVHEHDHHHGHAHDETCDHEHDHENEHVSVHAGNDHGHEHGWNPWRFAVLLIPVALFFLNLPNQGFTNVRANVSLDQVDLNSGAQSFALGADVIGLGASPLGLGPLSAMAAYVAGSAQGTVLTLEFKELEQAAYHPDQRDFYNGKRAEISGQFAPSASPRAFTLVRFKITCCAPDAVGLNVMIVSPEDVKKKRGNWVKVTGRIQFAKRKDRDEYVTVLQLASPKDVGDIEPPKNPYIQ